MKKTLLKISLVSLLCMAALSSGTAVFAQTAPQVQTNSATNIQGNSAMLNANVVSIGSTAAITLWFQYGPTISYGSQTVQQSQAYPGVYTQNITGLNPNSTYHFQIVAQNRYGLSYGQDMVFYTSQSYNGTYGGIITANAGPDLYLTFGQGATLQGSGYNSNSYPLNYSWSCSGGTLSGYNIAQPIYTAPYTNNYNGQNSYICTLIVSDGYGNSNSDSAIIYVNYNNYNTYNNNYIGYNNNFVQTNPATNVSSIQATLNGNLNVTGQYGAGSVYFQWGRNDYNYGSQTTPQYLSSPGSFSQVISNFDPNVTYHFRAVTQGSFGTSYGQDMTFYASGPVSYNYVTPQAYIPPAYVLGASSVATGLTNNFLTDSFLFPLLLIILMSWLYFTGRVYRFADWLKVKTKK